MSRRFLRTQRQRGAVIPLAALLMTVLILMVAFAVDLGRQRAERRDMQAVADVVSLDLARQLEGRNAKQIDNDPAFGNAVEDSAGRNGHAITVSGNLQNTKTDQPCDADITGPCLNVILGTWDDTAYSFTPCPSLGDPARESCIPEAVQVEAGNEIDYGFQPGSGDARRTAVARVGDAEKANFQVGSALLAINPQTSTVIGELLNSIAPGASVLSYEGLANANVTLEDLLVPLGIPLTAGSPQELLDTQVALDDLTVAAVTALENNGGDPADIAVLNDLIALGVSNAQVSLGEALGVNAPAGGAGAGIEINIPQLLLAGVFLADDEHFISIDDATLDLSNLGGVDLRLHGIEAPQKGGDHDGATATTSQISLSVAPTFDLTTDVTQDICDLPGDERTLLGQLLGGLIDLLTCTAGGSVNELLEVTVEGQTLIEAQVAEITVEQQIDCANEQLRLIPSPATVDLLAGVHLGINAYLAGEQVPATDTPIAELAVAAGAYSPGTASPQVFGGINGTPTATGTFWDEFDPPEARIGSSPLGLSHLLNATVGTLSVLELDLDALGNIVLSLVEPVLNTALGQLDTVLLQPLVQLLGIHLGGADLTPLNLQCDQSAVLLVE